MTSRDIVGQVVIVGSVNVDLAVQVPRAPVAGETVIGGAFRRFHGGKGANQAVAAARVGARVHFVGAVGDDDHGREASAALESEGIETSYVQSIRGVPTGVALVVVEGSGDNRIVVASGANSELAVAWVSGALEGRVDRGGVMLLNLEIPDPPLLEAVASAASAGMRVMLNAAPARPFHARLLEGACVLLVNEGEALSMTSREGVHDVHEAARALARRTHAAVVVTLGRGGALVAENGHLERLPGHDVEVVDATGAGDTFAGTLAAELASGRPMRESVDVAMGAAALSVGVVGAREGMPDRGSVEALLRGRLRARGRP